MKCICSSMANGVETNHHPGFFFETTTLCRVEELSLSEAPVATKELWDCFSLAEARKAVRL